MHIATGTVAKVDPDRRLVFGWAYVAVDKSGEPVVDHSGDVMEPASLEASVYDYVLHSREGNEMHEGPATSRLVESIVFTAEKRAQMGLPEGVVPEGWWVGFRVDDDEVWKRVKAGELKAFSIEGVGEREPLEVEA